MADEMLICSHCDQTGHLSRGVNMSHYEVFCPDINEWCAVKESTPPETTTTETDEFSLRDG
jgi:hypothetical protein